jgi:propanol-preferring alcohol dehydrogenase
LIPGSRVVVIGVGGLGHMAVMILKAVSASTIIALDKNQQALELARKLGADTTLTADDDSEAAIFAATGGNRVDAVLDFVGAGATISLSARVIRPLGEIVVIGRGAGSFAFQDRALPYGAGISTTFGGSKAELMALIALAESGKIKPHISRWPLSRTAAAFSELAAGTINGRAVISPDELLLSTTSQTSGQLK